MSKGSANRSFSSAYGDGYDRIFGTKKIGHSRKTYIVRDGKLVEAGPGDVVIPRAEIVSWNAGVLPEQVQEARKFVADENIDGVVFNPKGDVVCRDGRTYDKYLHARGLHVR